MTEIKTSFLKGKMNKDLDERLLPDGEYRDALNIQVGTSEGSSIGTVQNIAGSVKICDFDFLTNETRTVGSVSDEKNNAAYWLVRNEAPHISANIPNMDLPVVYADRILKNTPEKGCEIVFTDVHTKYIDFPTTQTTIHTNTIDVSSFDDFDIGMQIIGVYDNGGVHNFGEILQLNSNNTFGTTYSLNTEILTTTVPAYDRTDQSGNTEIFGTWYQDTLSVWHAVFDIYEFNQFGVQVGDEITHVNLSTGTVIDNIQLTSYTADVTVSSTFSSSAAFPAMNGPGTNPFGFIAPAVTSGTTVPIAPITLAISSTDPDFALFTVGAGVTGTGIPLGSTISAISGTYTNALPNDITIVDASGADLFLTPNQFMDITVTQPGILSLEMGGAPGDMLNIAALVLQRKPVLGLDSNRLITGINIIDDILLWTDGYTEPKKINIQRSIDGTDQINPVHTQLVNELTGLGLYTSPFVDVTESHISVIRKSPPTAPIIDVAATRREGIIEGTFAQYVGFSSGIINPDVDDFASVHVGDTFEGKIFSPTSGGVKFAIKKGDVLEFSAADDYGNIPTSPFVTKDLRVSILDIITNNGNGWLVFEARVLSKRNDIPTNVATTFAVALAEQAEAIFEGKFPRFATRYRYEDGEYSVYSPFSSVAFLPGGFDYHPRKGYNLGMVNRMSKVRLSNIIPPNIPKDVVEVEILYKEDSSPNIYTVDTLSRADEKTLINANGAEVNAWMMNSYEITSDTTKGVLPSNQLLRAWDNVPSSAKAQEIVGNRVVYGNYTQNMDLDVSFAERFTPSAHLSLRSQNVAVAGALPSVKSLRDYQVGIVYTDEYGRETPVQSSSMGTTSVLKEDASGFNRLEVQLAGEHPLSAKFLKFYIKEESAEYYNLAMDRWYDGGDGNIWLAFPSADRNKIDDESYIYLKKSSGATDATSFHDKLKVLAIENNAPDSIKYDRTPLGSVTDDGTGNPVFISEPSEGNDVFALDVDELAPTSLSTLSSYTGSRVFCQFGVLGVTDLSAMYEVSGIGGGDDGTNPIDVTITLAKSLENDIDIIFDGTGTLLTNATVTFYHDRPFADNRFEGRFFAKVFSTPQLISALTAEVSTDIDYEVFAQKTLWGANITPPASWTYDMDYQTGGDWDSTTRSVGATHYELIEDFILDCTTVKLWRFWTDFFRGGYHAGYDGRGDYWDDIWFVDKTPAAGTFKVGDCADCGFGYEVQPGRTGTGITSYGTTSSIEVGFGGIDNGEDGFEVADEDTLGEVYSVAQTLGTSGCLSDYPGTGFVPSFFDFWLSPEYSAESTFAEGLTPGTLLRWEEDPAQTTYTITNVETYFHSKISSTPGTIHPAFNSPQNLTRNWKLYLDKDMTANFNPMMSSTTGGLGAFNGFSSNSNLPGTLGYTAKSFTLQLLEPRDFNEEMPTNPAIWETEPKDQALSEIYYEASPLLPLSVTPSTVDHFIPVGSVLSHPMSGDIVPNTTVASTNGTTITTAGAMCVSIGCTGISVGDFIDITRPDGTIISHVITSLPQAPTYREFKIEADTALARYTLPWFNCYSFGNGVESNRVRDTFNKAYISNGVRASATIEKPYKKETRKSGMIYSGIYNSTSGTNNLNQFIQAEKITKDLNPTYGSIQKLYARKSDLVAICEDRVLTVLAHKDALYNADGSTNLTASKNVLGTAQPFSGTFGISQDPASFVSESYRAYFVDRQRGAVVRLSKNGLTPISEHGMSDWFKDHLKITDTIIGTYDSRKNEYNVTLNFKDGASLPPTTLSFNEITNGWVSFKSFIPEDGLFIGGDYYTFKFGKLWLMNQEDVGGDAVPRNTFYGFPFESQITTLLNRGPESVKNFKTLKYEGSQSKIDQFIQYEIDGAFYTDKAYHNLTGKLGWWVDSLSTDLESGRVKEFINKEGKWFNYIYGIPITYDPTTGGIIDGADVSNFALQGVGRVSSVTTLLVYGCTDPAASNFDVAANTDDNSCMYACDPATNLVISNVTASEFTISFTPSSGIIPGSSYVIHVTNTTNTPVSSTYTTTIPTYTIPATPGASYSVYIVNNCNGASAVSGVVSTTTLIPGCTDPLAANYDATATTDDGSCWYCVYGCMDSTQFNYDPNATCDDSSCVPFAYGCTDLLANNYDASANTDDGSCAYPCHAPNSASVATDGLSAATLTWMMSNDVNSYTLQVESISPPTSQIINNATSPALVNGLTPGVDYTYSLVSICDTSSSTALTGTFEITQIDGCTDPAATNYDAGANTDDGSCTYPCTSINPYQLLATETTIQVGWLNGYQDIDYLITWNDGFNDWTQIVTGLVANQYEAYTITGLNPDSEYYITISAVCPDGVTYMGATLTASTLTPIGGCTDSAAVNYDWQATFDDGSCCYVVSVAPSVTNVIVNGQNYLEVSWPAGSNIAKISYQREYLQGGPYFNVNFITVNDSDSPVTIGPLAAGVNFTLQLMSQCAFFGQGSNILWGPGVVASTTAGDGCTDAAACNYDATATVNDGSCNLIYGCTDPTADNYDPSANCGDPSSCTYTGCGVPAAINYNSNLAVTDVSNCVYCDQPAVNWVVSNAATSAVLTWDDVDGTVGADPPQGGYYTLRYRPQGGTWGPPGYIIIPHGNGAGVTYTLNGLAGGVTYDVEVNPHCGDDPNGFILPDMNPGWGNYTTFTTAAISYGCMDPQCSNYDVNANIDNGTCNCNQD